MEGWNDWRKGKLGFFSPGQTELVLFSVSLYSAVSESSSPQTFLHNNTEARLGNFDVNGSLKSCRFEELQKNVDAAIYSLLHVMIEVIYLSLTMIIIMMIMTNPLLL